MRQFQLNNFIEDITIYNQVLFSAPKPSFYHGSHDGPVVALERSPFMKEVLLSVGGWNFTIWKEGVSVSCT